MKKLVCAGILAVALGVAAPAAGDPPGPGDKAGAPLKAPPSCPGK